MPFHLPLARSKTDLAGHRVRHRPISLPGRDHDVDVLEALADHMGIRDQEEQFARLPVRPESPAEETGTYPATSAVLLDASEGDHRVEVEPASPRHDVQSSVVGGVRRDEAPWGEA